MNDLMFRDQTDSVARRASANSEASTSTSISTASGSRTRQPSPGREVAARDYFFQHFITPGHLAFLEGMTPDVLLLKTILACGTAGLANRDNASKGNEVARRYYVEAIAATNTALRHPTQVKDDSTLISVHLLALYERLTWEAATSIESWKQHVQGSAQVLELRGRHQIITPVGAALFRNLRASIIVNCLWSETEAPQYLVQWTQALEYDPMHTPADRLALIAVRVAALKYGFRTRDKRDNELADMAASSEADLISWSEETLAADSICSFHNVIDPESSHSWNGARHEYRMPHFFRYWNMWRCLRILVSRVHEAVWRRSWPTLPQTPPSPEHFRTTRERMATDICVTAAYALSSDNSADPPQGSVSSGYLLITPLCLAALCLIEQLAEPTVSPGGSKIIHINEPLHLDPFNSNSTQLAWIIERVDYIADKIGIKWATAVSKFLKGESKVHYDLGRSRVIMETEVLA
ncbi:hypothetical protein LTR85_001313 [Meristemomyces frigidus]|nr:hypothetical protein LTR85_001313 [Meristemomyces frigidus]